MRWLITIISLILFLYLITSQNWSLFLATVKGIHIMILLSSLAFYFIGVIINSVRWYILVRAIEIRISLLQTIKIVLLGAYTSNFLPSTIGGDMIRILCLIKTGNRKSVIIASVIMDRLINILAMTAMLPISFLTFKCYLHQLNIDRLMYGMILLSHKQTSMDSDGSKWRYRFFSLIHSITNAFKSYIHCPKILLLCLFFSWLSALSVFMGIWIISIGLNMDISFLNVIGITALSYFITLLPISINGYGIREIAVTSLYTILGASIEQSLSLALLTRMMMLIISLPGIFWQSEVLTKSS